MRYGRVLQESLCRCGNLGIFFSVLLRRVPHGNNNLSIASRAGNTSPPRHGSVDHRAGHTAAAAGLRAVSHANRSAGRNGAFPAAVSDKFWSNEIRPGSHKGNTGPVRNKALSEGYQRLRPPPPPPRLPPPDPLHPPPPPRLNPPPP